MRQLPKRLMQDELDVSVHEGRLRIGHCCFDGAHEKLPESPSINKITPPIQDTNLRPGNAEELTAPILQVGSMNDDNVENPTFALWPGDWPGRAFVDLDNMGDAGCWIEAHIPFPDEILSSDSNDTNEATELANIYIDDARKDGHVLPTDFEMSEDEMHEIITKEFVGFIQEWRKRANAERDNIQNRAIKTGSHE